MIKGTWLDGTLTPLETSTATPEPTSFILIAIGVFGTCLLSRRAG